MYSADFETTTDENDCRVWAWGAMNVDNFDFSFGNNIVDFLDFAFENGGQFVFHNLAFDGSFIISELFRVGYQHTTNRPQSMEFSTLISKQGKFYRIEICRKKGTKRNRSEAFVCVDSLKMFPFSVAEIAQAFNLETQKGEIDYNEYREIGHNLTQLELDYLYRDCRIIAEALKIRNEEGLTKLTIGSDAMNGYVETITKRKYAKIFPIMNPAMDNELRKAYKGGYVYVSEKHKATKRKDVIVADGSVYDVNSLYPYVMYTKNLPYGKPLYYRGEYVQDNDMPIYICQLRLYAKLKKGKHFPTLQIKNSPYYIGTEYIKNTYDYVDLTLTNIDYELMLDNYDVDVVKYYGGYKFTATVGLFEDYISYWSKIKETSKGGRRVIAKLFLNSLYGKFGTNPDVTGKEPYYEDEIFKLRLGEKSIRDTVYVPMAAFITSYAREHTIRTAMSVYDRFLYCDTDSLHLLGTEPPNIDIHPFRMGAWKHEGNFTRARYIRAKSYIEEMDSGTNIVMAGCPKSLHQHINFENCKQGLVLGSDVDGAKLRPKRVKGGVVLVPTSFQIL